MSLESGTASFRPAFTPVSNVRLSDHSLPTAGVGDTISKNILYSASSNVEVTDCRGKNKYSTSRSLPSSVMKERLNPYIVKLLIGRAKETY
jgi:hypothetical protein